MKAKNIAATAMAALLSACVSLPSGTLDQKLAAATTANDRKEILRLACLNEAEFLNGKYYPVMAFSRGHSRRHTPSEVYKAKALCSKLDSLTDGGDKNTPETRSVLLGQCTSMLETYAWQYPSDKRHVTAMTEICREMTK